MFLHLFWLVPAILFFLLFLWEPRRLFNAYLFTSIILLFLAIISGLLIVHLEHFDKETALASALILFLMIPISVILSTLYLLFNGRQMMTFEGLRLANLLSLFYGLALIIGIGLNFLPQYPILNAFKSLVNTLLIYGTFLYLSYIFYGKFYNFFPILYKPDYIIVLGSGLIGDKVSPLLAQRLNLGMAFHQKFPQSKIIVSGGQGKDELTSEAEAMASYLEDKGIARQSILIENKSTTTHENLIFSKQLLGDTVDKQTTYLVVTNSFHALRAGIYMKRLKLRGRSVGSKTALYYLPSAYIRETVGLFMMSWKWHAIFLGTYLLGWFVNVLMLLIEFIF